MKSIRLILLFGALVLSAIAAAQFGRQNMVDWGTFTSGTNSKFTEQAMLTLNSESDFMNYWQRATGNPAQAAPKGVDWIKYKLVALHLGPRPTSGYSIIVQNITKNGVSAVIHGVEQTPLKNQYVAPVQSSPYVIVKVERNVVDLQLSMTSRQAHPQIILGPGGSYIGPKDNDGAGWVDPKFQCDWGTVQSGIFSRIAQPEMVVLNTETDFLNYYERAFGQRAPRSGVDWYRYRLVAIHIGQRETGGYEVSVRNVIKNGASGVVRAVEETPVPGQTVNRRATSPFVIIRVERTVVQVSLDMSARQAKEGIVIIGNGRRGGGR